MKTFDFDHEEQIAALLGEAVRAYAPPPGMKEAIAGRLFSDSGDVEAALTAGSPAMAPDSLTPQVVRAMSRPSRWNWPRLPRYAAGGAIAVSLVILLAVLAKHEGVGVAFADVQAAIQRTKTAMIVAEFSKTPWMNHRILYRSDSDVVREEWPNGEVCLRDAKHGRYVVINPKKKTMRDQDFGSIAAGLMPGVGSFSTARELLDYLATIEQRATSRLGSRELDGRTLFGFALPRNTFAKNVHMLCQIWVDPQSHLPVRYEFLPEDPSDLPAGFLHGTLTFTFNQPLDSSLFQFSVPQDYTVLRDESLYMPYLSLLPPPPKDKKLASPVVVPGVGIGDAKFGMRLEDVLAALGTPDLASNYYEYTPEESRQMREAKRKASREADKKGLKGLDKRNFVSQATQSVCDEITKREPSGINLTYLSRGFLLVLLKDQGLTRISCVGEHLAMRPFTGKTSNGIALGATMQEIEAAYGPATVKSERNRQGDSGLYYKTLATMFQLKNDRLNGLSLDKP
jgi:hypothetical protein